MFKEFFSISTDLLCIASFEGHFLEVSPSFIKTLGYTEEEFKKTPIIDFVHPEDVSATIEQYEKQKNGETISNFENRYICKDGTYRVLSWSSSVDLAEKIIYASARDVTSLRHIENRLNHLDTTLGNHSIIALTDKKGLITRVNKKFCEISGYSEKELIGQSHRLVSSGVHPKEFWEKMWSTISSGKSWSGYIENKSKNGSHYHVYSIISPLFNSQKIIEGYQAIRFEVTKEVLLRKYLKRTLGILNETNAIAKVGGWELIVDTGEQHWTDETFKILEVDKKNGQTPMLPEGLNFFVPEHRSIIEKAIKNVIEEGTPYYLELQALTAKEKVLWVFVTGKAHYENGKVVRLSGTIQDIDDRKKTELKLIEEEIKSRQNAKLAILGEISAGIAHEVNNPLTVIMGNIELLSKLIDRPEDFNQKIENIKKSCHRINTITKNLVKYARKNEGSDFKAITLESIVTEALSLADLKAKKFNFHINFESHSQSKILCNEVEIEQVIVNLVNNAIDATKDLDDKWAKVTLDESDDKLILKVIDSGSSMSQEIVDKIFEPFFTTKDIGEGTGLGLSISRGILEKHNASISIDLDSKNTCFMIVFSKYV